MCITISDEWKSKARRTVVKQKKLEGVAIMRPFLPAPNNSTVSTQ